MSTRDGQVTAGIGADPTRVEDRRLVTGEARFTDDLPRPNARHVAFLRSPVAHARIGDIDTARAEAREGVTAVITAADIEAADVATPGRIPIIPPPGIDPSERLHRSLIADDVVRYQGEIVAVVVAADRYAASDALGDIEVEYERLDAVVDPGSDGPTIHEDAPGNVAFEHAQGDEDRIETAFERASHVVEVEIGNQRLVQNPIEPRAAVVDYDPADGSLTYEGTTQIPHKLRRDLAAILDHPERRIRVAAPDMGGGFGSRCVVNPEEPLLAWCAKYLEEPLRWQSTRSECYETDTQGRGVETRGRLGLDEDGGITALRIDLVDDLGAYLSGFAPGIAMTCTNVMTGQYDIPATYYHVTGVLTNTVPSDAYRGVIEAELIHTLERLMDLAAHEVGIDPAELRRHNLVPSDAFPYETASGGHYDSGDYEPALDKALDIVGYEDVRKRQRELREEGRYLGVGIGAWIEKCGFGCGGPVTSWEYSNLQVHPDGGVTVYCGTHNHGQGHETTYAQVVSDTLGLPLDDVEVVEGDTARVKDGVGTYASRCALTAGNSIAESAGKVISKGRRIAANRLEADRSDVVFEDGTFSVAGAPDRSVSLRDIAAIAHVGDDLPEGTEPGLEATSYYDIDEYTFPFGIQIAVVEVDPDTGDVSFESFVSVDDCGTQINPRIVQGQVHGGIAQGIGQARSEGAVYDVNGALLSGSHMEYALPRARDIPELTTADTVTPSPRNPLGIKGVGESGTVGAVPAVVNAVQDALRPLGVGSMTPPLTDGTVWRAIHDAT